MGRNRRQILSVLTICCLLVAGSVNVKAAEFPAIDFEFLTDARLAIASGEPSWFNGRFGKLRYGGKSDGESRAHFRLAEASVIAKTDFTWDLHGFVHAKFDPEQDKPLDLVEAYVRYRPAPSSKLRYEMRAGLFFPHISRENTSIAWTSPFTITPSAINSWIGEEIRTLGFEAKATLKMDGQKVSLTGGVFGFNDPAGSLLAFRGWALGDYKVGAFSQVPLPAIPSISPGGFLEDQPFWVHPIREVDNKPGFYGAIDWSKGRKFKAGVFYYDNRGNPEVLENNQYAWDTRFWHFYSEVKAPLGIHLIGQYMTGRTEMGGIYKWDKRYVDTDYAAGFLMATKKVGKHRISLRRDWFDVDDNSFIVYDNNNEVGTAWTLAFNAKVGKKANIIAELLRVESTRPARETFLILPKQNQNQLQVSYRQRF